MGGKLFNLGRIPQNQYLEIEHELRVYLDEKFRDGYRIPRYYRQKADFGDMDVLLRLETVDSSSVIGNVHQDLLRDLGITRYRSAGNVFSTVFREFQVDYFPCQPKFFETTYNFLCFNDLGNLLGKIFRRMGLKYGMEGLYYVYRWQNGHTKSEIEVSRDTRRMFAFLELDYEAWEQGFETLESMFDWVVACPYFSVYPYVKTSATTDKRIQERFTMRRFLDYLKACRIEKTYVYHEDRELYVPHIAAFFPEANLPEHLAQVKADEQRRELISAKFNGRMVMEWIPGLAGKELGQLMKELKESFPDFEDFVLAASPETIQKEVTAFYESFRKTHPAAS